MFSVLTSGSEAPADASAPLPLPLSLVTQRRCERTAWLVRATQQRDRVIGPRQRRGLGKDCEEIPRWPQSFRPRQLKRNGTRSSRRHPDAALAITSWRWRRVMENAFGHQTVYLAARRGDEVVGVLPAVMIKSRLFGRSLVSLPFLNYGGVVATDAGVARLLLDHAANVGSREGASHSRAAPSRPAVHRPAGQAAQGDDEAAARRKRDGGVGAAGSQGPQSDQEGAEEPS